MKPNYSSGSLENNLRLSFTPPHSRTGTQSSDKATPLISTPEAREMFEFTTYQDIDSGQKVEFEMLLRKVLTCTCTCNINVIPEFYILIVGHP